MLWTLFERAVWVSFALSVIGWICHNWYDSFFAELSQKQAPYRLLQIWVQSDRPSESLSPIGSNEKDFSLWRRYMEHFLAHASVTAPSGARVELVLDEKTYQKHQLLIQHWLRTYPQNFELRLLETVLQQESDYPQCLSNLCYHGIAASCSDFLRIMLLPEQKGINVYLDIDTFIFRHNHQKKPFADFDPLATTSAHALGLSGVRKGIFVGMQTQSQGMSSTLSLNNDCLILAHSPPLWDLVHLAMTQELAKYQKYLLLLNQRSQIVSYESYLQNLQQRVLWAQENAHLNVNQFPLVVQIAGPMFWKSLYEKRVVQPYHLPHLPSEGGWMSNKGRVQGQTPYALMGQYLGTEKADQALKMMLMSHDWKYFLKKDASWASLIEKDVFELWDALTEQEKLRIEELIGSPVSWIREAHHAAA